MEGFYWALGIVVVGLGVFANYVANVDWWKRLTADKDAQPMLAFSIDNFTRQQNRENDRYYVPFDVAPGEALDFEQQQEISFDYEFVWSYIMHITNQTEHTAYKLTVNDVVDKQVLLVVDPKIDYTKPITANAFKEHTFIYRMHYRCKGVDAEKIRSGYPVNILRIEYSNLAGARFATEFSFDEKDVTKKNVYIKVS